MIKAVIFDLDNTLCNTNKALTPSFNTCYKYLYNYYPKINKGQFTRNTVRVFNNLTRKQKLPLYTTQALFWDEMFKSLSIKPDPVLIKDLVLLLDDEIAKNVELFNGVDKLLKDLKTRKLKLAILSNGQYVSKAQRLQYLNISKYFDFIISTDLIRRDKPSKRPFLYTLDKLKVKPNEAVFVGDELEADISGAKDVGIYAVYNLWNARKLKAEEDIVPDFSINRPQDLIQVLKQIEML